MKRIAIESCNLSVQELARLAETEPVVLIGQEHPYWGSVALMRQRRSHGLWETIRIFWR
jgi:hypothetical protein